MWNCSHSVFKPHGFSPIASTFKMLVYKFISNLLRLSTCCRKLESTFRIITVLTDGDQILLNIHIFNNINILTV